MSEQQKQQQQQQENKKIELTPEQLEKKKRKEELQKAKKAAKAEKFAKKQQQQKQQQQQQTNKNEKKENKKKESKKVEINFKPTPIGLKKDINSIEMPSQYQPHYVEEGWYEWWNHEGFFKPEYHKSDKKFVIVIPPPNVTGKLHLGHALTNSIQDTIVRFHRMEGEETLWVPGVDHAGIATQVVVEKKIMKERGLTRHDLGREAFISEVWKWKEEYGENIMNQLKRLGSSLDWTRSCFTFDKQREKAVIETFNRLYEKGLLYRETRLVNWCCQLRTALSDVEVDYIDVAKPTQINVPGYDKPITFGEFTHFAYPVCDKDGNLIEGEELVVATTRLETMLVDSAVAINSKDERYTKYHGKFVKHPFNNEVLPIILDDDLVEIGFGTGAVKITPAHDPNDYECGKKHGLKIVNMLNDDGTCNELCGQFKGMKRFDARIAVLEALKEKGLYRGTTPTPMRIPVCQRSKDIIEPRVKPQWWVNCKDMAKKSIEAVERGEITMFPESMKEVFYRWMNNIRDWCVSRQLWWGHRIPAYLIVENGKPHPDAIDINNWVVARSEEDAHKKVFEKRGLTKDQYKLEQDPDVLDTWFSSGLFPFATMGWPDQTADLERYYPNTLLETGHDIVFFWVARMIMFGIEIMGKVPFSQVLFHSMVRDSHGRKMSKSLGNVIDPLDVIDGVTLQQLLDKLKVGNLTEKEFDFASKSQKEDYPNGIEECGTDAMRFALLAYMTQGNDINLDVNRVVGYRNFCNKIWNSVRFAMGKFENIKPQDDENIIPEHASYMDKWILNNLYKVIEGVRKGFTTYEFGQSTSILYQFFLYDFCDVYLESTKSLMYSKETDELTKAKQQATGQVIYTVIEIFLRLIHPFMPFVTEELWQRIPKRDTCKTPSIMVSPYPTLEGKESWLNKTIEEEIKIMFNLVKSIRSLNGPYSQAITSSKKKPELSILVKEETIKKLIEQYITYITELSNVSKINILTEENDSLKACAVFVYSPVVTLYSHLKGIINVEVEIQKLTKNLNTLNQNKKATEKKIADPHFTTKTPQDVQQQIREKLTKIEGEIKVVEDLLANLKEML